MLIIHRVGYVRLAAVYYKQFILKNYTNLPYNFCLYGSFDPFYVKYIFPVAIWIFIWKLNERKINWDKKWVILGSLKLSDGWKYVCGV